MSNCELRVDEVADPVPGPGQVPAKVLADPRQPDQQAKIIVEPR